MKIAAKKRIEKYGNNLLNEETREKSNLAARNRKGMKMPEETKKKIGDANRGKVRKQKEIEQLFLF